MSNDNRSNDDSADAFPQAHHRRPMIEWLVGGLVLVLLAALFVVPLFFNFAGRPYGYYPFPFFIFPFGFLIFFILISFVVRGVFWGWGWGWRGGYGRGYWRGHGYDADATEILRRRYARGEITKDQFDQMMRDLKAQSP